MNIFQNILHFNFDIFLKNVNFLNRNFEKVKKWDFDKINLNSLFVEINTPNVIKHYYTFSQSQKKQKNRQRITTVTIRCRTSKWTMLIMILYIWSPYELLKIGMTLVVKTLETLKKKNFHI